MKKRLAVNQKRVHSCRRIIRRTLPAAVLTGSMLAVAGCSNLQKGGSQMSVATENIYVETEQLTNRETEGWPQLLTEAEMCDYDEAGGYAYEYEPAAAMEEYADESTIAYSAAADGMISAQAYNGIQLPAEGWYADPDWNTEEYSYRAENSWMNTKTSPFSTFAADVDTASYANIRRMIQNGTDIPADAVRIEEMINYFSYDYPEPAGEEPFSVTTELAPCPWNENTDLLLIGLQAKKPDTGELPPSNFVFLIDVSGSMDEPDKLPLVQRSFHLLTEQLGSEDRISIVTYAAEDQIVLDGAHGDETAVIDGAVEDLMAGGGTNGSAGILTAYELAKKHFIKNGNNRVILATDGDLNIGVTDEGSLTRLIEEQAESGVYLSVLGFGTGNISDTNMEALADHGNGNYSYIDEIAEARKVLISEMGGTLQTVADDVKLQVEFNPAEVKGYRLIGYENRTMAAEDFADDEKDGGEIGAGHRVTALYEIARNSSGQEIPEVVSRYQANAGSQEAVEETDDQADQQVQIKASEDEWLTVNIRYKDPGEDVSNLLVTPVTEECFSEEMSDNLSWAAGVAQTGMLLGESQYAGTTTLEDVKTRLGEIQGVSRDDLRIEFLYLLGKLANR